MFTWSWTYRQNVFKWEQSKNISKSLPSRWWRKPAGIDMERNYVSVTLCIGNESVQKIIINNTINLFFLNAIGTLVISNRRLTVSVCCLIKLLPRILFQKYIDILALEMASPGKQHCANCIGTHSFPGNENVPKIITHRVTVFFAAILWVKRL